MAKNTMRLNIEISVPEDENTKAALLALLFGGNATVTATQEDEGEPSKPKGRGRPKKVEEREPKADEAEDSDSLSDGDSDSLSDDEEEALSNGVDKDELIEEAKTLAKAYSKRAGKANAISELKKAGAFVDGKASLGSASVEGLQKLIKRLTAAMKKKA